MGEWVTHTKTAAVLGNAVATVGLVTRRRCGAEEGREQQEAERKLGTKHGR